MSDTDNKVEETQSHPGIVNTEAEPETLRHKVMNMGALLAVMMPLSMGLGYLQELGNEKEDQRILNNMSQAQHDIVTLAARNDTCGTLRHNFARICWKQQQDIKNTRESVASIENASIDYDNHAL